MISPEPDVIAQLAPHGVLRAAINLSNSLLVVGKDNHGNPVGPSPDLARAISDALGVDLVLVSYATPSAIAAAATTDEWDIGNIGAEPQRATVMDFSPAYAEIEATYLVPFHSPIQAVAEVDKAGHRVSVVQGAAYALWLENNLAHAQLNTFDGKQAFNEFANNRLTAYAGLRSQLVQLRDIDPSSSLPKWRVLDGCFTTVKQSVGVRKNNEAAHQWIHRFVEEAKRSGLIAELINRHNVAYGLVVAPRAPSSEDTT